MDNNKLTEKIKILRDKTGISLSECKKALIENNLDLEKSINFLKKNEIKSIRNNNSSEGIIIINIEENKKSAVMAEINCETDFVSRSEEFLNFCKNVCNFYLKETKNNINTDLENEKNFLIKKLKENIVIKRIKKFNTLDGLIFGYAHSFINYGKIASIIEIIPYNENITECAKNIAMQIVAMNPKYLKIESISEELIQKEKTIIEEYTKKTYNDKNEKQINAIISSKLKNFYNENVLLEQKFIKDEKILIKELIKKNFEIINFTRFELGEN